MSKTTRLCLNTRRRNYYNFYFHIMACFAHCYIWHIFLSTDSIFRGCLKYYNILHHYKSNICNTDNFLTNKSKQKTCLVIINISRIMKCQQTISDCLVIYLYDMWWHFRIINWLKHMVEAMNLISLLWSINSLGSRSCMWHIICNIYIHRLVLTRNL